MAGLFPQWTRRQWATAVVIAFAEFATSTCISILPLFYPAEAERKGVSASRYGLVFGCYELVVFLFSPLSGKRMSKWIPSRVIHRGLFITGSCTILFGLLDQIEDTEVFIGLSYTVRIIEALAYAPLSTAAYAVIVAEFPDSVGTTFASLQTFFGLGFFVGPTLGGFLYQSGGYLIPFLAFGLLRISASVLACSILPSPVSRPGPESFKHQKGLLNLIKIPAILLCAYGVFTASVSVGFTSATMEPHIRPFDLPPVLKGSIFVVNGGVYTLTAPIWGILCDRVILPRVATMIGALFLIISFSLIGPAPFLPYETTLALTILGLIFMGLGVGGLFVSGFAGALREATFRGFPNNLSTYGMIGGLWMSSFSLGSFVGPSVAGVLVDQVGFRYGTYFVIITSGLLAALVGLFLCFPDQLAGNVTTPVPLDAPTYVNYETLPSTSDAERSENATVSRLKESFASDPKELLSNA